MADLEFSKSGAASQPSLETGLAALRRKDYRVAIAHLAPLSDRNPNKVVQMKARMGLVMAYEQSGNIQQAIALCQYLQTSSSAQARQWANQMLEDLAQRYPHLQSAETGGDRASTPPHLPSDSTSEDLSAYLNGAIRARGAAQPTPSSTPAPANSSTALIPHQNSRSTPSLLWRQSERAECWSPLEPLDRAFLWGLGGLSLVVLAVVLRFVLLIPVNLSNALVLALVDWVDLRSLYIYQDPLIFALLLLLASFVALPWLMPAILRRFYRMQPFSLEALERHSPEAGQVTDQFFKQRQWSPPALGLLPSSAPLIFTWGILPQKATLVMSQGLLQQLEADELAVLVAAEIGHIEHLDFMPLSLITLVAQLPYLSYRQLATWGDGLLGSPSARKRQDKASQAIAVLFSGLSYGLYRLLRVPGLGLSRLRLYYGDRTATNLTGNPNALIRALMKLSLGISRDIETRQQTDPLLESFDLLLPVGPRAALTLGSIYAQNPDMALFRWDLSSPYRFWLALNNSHALMGDRLLRLAQHAQQWQLEPELDLDFKQPSQTTQRLTRQTTKPTRTSRSRFAFSTPPLPFQSALFPPLSRGFLLQLAPFLGLLCGWAIALIMWQFGNIATQLKWYEVDWMNQDKGVFWGLLSIGFGVGMLLRINCLFPDCKPSNTQVNPPLADLLSASIPLPVEGQPVQFQGTLLGRRGLGNRLSQDLFLNCESGSIRLHYVPRLGPWVSLIAEIPQPTHLLQRRVTVTGWFRRGATPWIDVERIQPTKGQGQILGGAPIWSTAVAIAATLWGTYAIFTGGI